MSRAPSAAYPSREQSRGQNDYHRKPSRQIAATPTRWRDFIFRCRLFGRAINSRDLPVPLAKDFASELSRSIGEDNSIPLTILSEIYQEQNDDPLALVKLIKSTFSVKNITPQQQAILSYPWKQIYTTNYDDVAEHVKAPSGTRPHSYSRNSIPLTFEGNDRQIVHINGYVGTIDRDTTIDDFALTFSSYVDSNLFSSKWATTLRQDFLLADVIVFAGYSLYDTDISRILGENPALKAKTIAIQWKGLSTADERFLTHFGSVLKIGNDGLAQLISEILKDGVAAINVTGPENFEEILLPSMPVAETITDIVSDLVIFDVLKKSLAISSDRFRRAERYRTFNSKVMQFSNINSLVGTSKNKYQKIADF